ncbi:MAG: sigma-54-dependent Fis family transcriptional regulator [Deltaproteobacteria bacterium]|nr:sigma-54-dependent Fis family transcriptional regulator [Deltaproteobacteria bacterium]
MIGNSQAIRDLRCLVAKLGTVDSTVLILGESGTGKELVARAIHAAPSRGDRPFMAINCGAIPEQLLESELFGHRRGSFTDAKSDRKGIFEACSDGTLLLDEIGDMPLTLQTKLLRVLQERQITPIGATAPMPIATRVIAATHRDIASEAKMRRFREDLYYRLSVVVVRLPPLRERRDDIPLLTEHFLQQFNRRFDRRMRSPDHATMTQLIHYDWPGNVRELQNMIERAVVLASDDELRIDTMFSRSDAIHVMKSAERAEPTDLSQLPPALLALPLSEAKQQFERSYIRQLLQRSRGNISEAARISGRYRADIYRLMNRYNLACDLLKTSRSAEK